MADKWVGTMQQMWDLEEAKELFDAFVNRVGLTRESDLRKLSIHCGEKLRAMDTQATITVYTLMLRTFKAAQRLS